MCVQKEKIMKTVKIIPVLMAAMLVSACNTNGKVKVSEPKFAKDNGTEMTSDDFIKEFITIDGYNIAYDGPAIKDSEFFKEGAKVSSKEMKMKMQNALTESLKRDDKEIEKTEAAQVTESTVQADADNKVVKTVTSLKSSGSSKTQTGSGSQSASSKATGYTQEGKVDDKNGVIAASVEQKLYRLQSAFDTEEPRTYTSDTWFDLEMQSMGQSLGRQFLYNVVYAKMMGAELKGYNFYKNDKVYTVTYSSEETETKKEEEWDAASSSIKEVEYATETTKVESKSQFDVTEGKWSWKYSAVETVETKYLKDKGDNLVGDVQSEKEESYMEYNVNSKSVKVKALDVSAYKVLKA